MEEVIKNGIEAALKVSFVESYKKKDTNNSFSQFDPKKVLTYTPWAKAVEEALRLDPNFDFGWNHPSLYLRSNPSDPNAITNVVEDKNRNYFTDGNTCWVETWCVLFGKKKEMTLPVMDATNKAIPLKDTEEINKKGEKVIRKGVTSMDVNKAIMRCLVKNLAVGFGLGISIYYGEEFNEDEKQSLAEEYVARITECKTREEVTAIYNDAKYTMCKGKPEAMDALKKRLAEIDAEVAKSAAKPASIKK